MQFKNWLINELKIDPKFNPAKRTGTVSPEPRWSSTKIFYIDKNGKIIEGYPVGGSWKPYYEINYKTKYLRAHNIDPSSSQFKQIIAILKKYIPNIEQFDVDQMNLSHAQVSDHLRNYYRSVNYWLKQKNSDIKPNRLPEFLYHGTSTELWYSGIKQKGLMPRKQSQLGAAGSYGSGSALSHGDKVYLAVHPDNATRGAATQAASQHGGLPLILKISTKGLYPEKFTGDEDIDREYEYVKKTSQDQGRRIPSFASVSQSRMGSVAYNGRIPPSLIQPFVLGEKHITGNRQGMIKDWIPFKDVAQQEHPLTIKLKEAQKNGYGISEHDSPYFYALVDEGILKSSKQDRHHYVVNDQYDISDKNIRNIIKQSSWVRDAEAISKNISDWGLSGIKSLDYYPVKVDDPNYQYIIDMLLNSKIYHREDEYIKRNSWGDIENSIHLAKTLYKRKMNYNDLLSAIEHIGKKYKPI